MTSARNQELAEQMFLQLKFEARIYPAAYETLRKIAMDAAEIYEKTPNNNGMVAVSYAIMFIQMRIEQMLKPRYREVIAAYSKRNFSKLSGKAKMQRKDDSQYESDFLALSEQWIDDNGLAASDLIADTTRKDILDVIVKGQQEGLGAAAIAKLIRDKVGDEISRYRAQTIAITETHNAASFANYESARLLDGDLELGLKKQWLATEDARTRPAHHAANNQVRDMDEKFNVGGAAMTRPGDPAGGSKNVVRCRCVTRFITTDDEE